MKIKKLIQKLKKVAKIKIYTPKPRSEGNMVWKKIKQKIK